MRTILLASVALAMASPAIANPCGPTAKVFATIYELFKEVPAFTASAGANAVVTITISPTGSWSAIEQTEPNVACVVASGEHWAEAPESLKHPEKIVPGKDA